MSDAWATAVGTVCGAIVGGVTAFSGQSILWKRQQRVRWDAAKSAIYGGFLGNCDHYYLRMRYFSHELRKPHIERANNALDGAEKVKPGLASAHAEVAVLATGSTRELADALNLYLENLNTRFYNDLKQLRDNKQIHVESIGITDKGYDEVREPFIKAIRAELGITGNKSRRWPWTRTQSLDER